MYAMNIDLHKVSLGALIISLGMLVDDAIVVVELMEVKMSEGWERTKAASYAFETCAMPLLTGTLITCTALCRYFSPNPVPPNLLLHFFLLSQQHCCFPGSFQQP